MEIKTCEERVLMELEGLEKENAGLKEEMAKLRGSLDYAKAILGVVGQICVLEELEDGSTVFRGGYRFDPKTEGAAIKALECFRKPEAGGDDASGAAAEPETKGK